MYQEHPVFKLSCAEDSKVWRFMDFTKFVSMLEEGALWFSRADCLGDPFDSEIPNALIAKKKQGWEETRKEAMNANMPAELKEVWLRQIEGGPQFWNGVRFWHAVNCWHQNDHESAAMWNVYLKSDEGIAVVSTAKKLLDSVRDAPFVVFVGNVEYVDFENYPPFDNLFAPVMRKRKSFEHEREVRVVVLKEMEDRKGAINPQPFEEKGFPIKVDLGRLIDRIVVSPTAQEWFGRLVEQVARRFNLTCEVRRSLLAERPIW